MEPKPRRFLQAIRIRRDGGEARATPATNQPRRDDAGNIVDHPPILSVLAEVDAQVGQVGRHEIPRGWRDSRAPSCALGATPARDSPGTPTRPRPESTRARRYQRHHRVRSRRPPAPRSARWASRSSVSKTPLDTSASKLFARLTIHPVRRPFDDGREVCRYGSRYIVGRRTGEREHERQLELVVDRFNRCDVAGIRSRRGKLRVNRPPNPRMRNRRITLQSREGLRRRPRRETNRRGDTPARESTAERRPGARNGSSNGSSGATAAFICAVCAPGPPLASGGFETSATTARGTRRRPLRRPLRTWKTNRRW